jgi:lysophospholipase L1-like esterase
MRIIFGIFLILTQVMAFSQNDTTKNDWPNLQKYAMENKNLTSKQPNSKRVVLMGDSITEFWQPSYPDFYTQNGFINRGISGQTTPQMLLRFRSDVIELQPEAVVILAGINDIAENTGPISLEATMGNIISMVELAKANNIKVVLCSVLPANVFWWNANILPADKVIALNNLIKGYAKKNSITYIDYYSPMVDSQKGLDKKWADDGVHPNAAGYKLMEPLLIKAVGNAVKKGN